MTAAWPRTRRVPNLTAFAASAAIMLMELAAGPLISRHVGMSLYTWTAVIGVVMAGMAIGNAIGGAIADRAAPARALAAAFLLAALGVAAILPLNALLGSSLAPLALAWPLRIALHVSGVFLLPAVLLGGITPLVARLALQVQEDAGKTVGAVFAWSVAGSIAGTFLTGYYLIYAVGVRELMLGAAAALGTLGVYFAVASARAGGYQQSAREDVPATALPGPTRSAWVIAYATVIASNALFMMLELAASRVISRQFGSSIYTWTAVIGVVLAGITLGNYLGGRIADRDASRERISKLFITASALAFLAPIASKWMGFALDNWLWLGVLSWPLQITLHMAVAFFLPCVAIGTISPVVVKRLLDAGARPGRSIGGVYAWGSAGGILGTFAMGYFLIDWFGSLPMLGIVTAALAIVGAAYLPLPRRIAWAIVMSLLAVIAVSRNAQMLHIAQWAGLHHPASALTVYEDESQYSYLAVTRDEDNPRLRQMILDKLMHSQTDLDDPLALKYEYEWIYEGVLDLAHPGRDAISAMVIGGGGFAFPHYLEVARPGSYVETSEIDPAVTEAAHAAFGLPRDTTVQIYNMDARNRVDDIVRAQAAGQEVPQFDCVLGDSINDYTVPRHLTTLEFARQVDGLLKPDGLYLLNLIDMLDSGRFVGAVVTTLREVFPQVEVYNTGRATDVRDTFVVVCSKTPRDFSKLLPGLQKKYRYKGWKIDLDKLLTPERRLLLTDNYAPVDLLLRPVIATRQHDRGEAYFDAAREAFAAGNLDEALGLAETAHRYHREWPALDEFMAAVYEKQGNRPARLEALRRAVVHHPEPVRAWTALGTAALEAGQKGEGYEALAKAISLDMNNVAARSELGKQALADGRMDVALEQWETLSILTPDSAGTWYNLGLAHAGLQHYDKAVAAWRRAIELDPKFLDSYHNAALALHLLKRDDEAREVVEALQAQGGTPDAKLMQELSAR